MTRDSRSLSIAFIFAAGALCATTAFGQQVYRCGNTYSQTPCPDGKTIVADDARTPAQKAANDATIARERKAGEDMERARLKAEAMPVPVARTPKAQQQRVAEATPKKKKEEPKLKKGKTQLEVFTAVAPGEKKKKEAAPKKSKKKAVD